MDLWDDMSEEEYEEELKNLLSLRQKINDPLTSEDVLEFSDMWFKEHLGSVEIETEIFCFGDDDDGYIILGHITPLENNPERAHFFLNRCENYKSKHKARYKIEFVSSFDEEDEDDDDVFMDVIAFTNNKYSAIEMMMSYWKSFLIDKDI